jgi:hypothetical protein
MASKRDEAGALKYFSEEEAKYTGLLKQAHLIGNAVRNRKADPLRVISS